MKYLILLLVSLSACTLPPVSPEPVSSSSPVPAQSPAPSAGKVWPQYGWQPEYEQVLLDWLPKMPDMTANMTIVCPRWKSVDQKAVWVKFWKSIVQCETDFNRASWFQEDMGTDPVTGKLVASQGLAQLSYQDVPNYNTAECNKISWVHDKSLPPRSLDATINDPIINLSCAMSIAKRCVEKNPHYWASYPDEIAFRSYWSCSGKAAHGISIFKSAAPECK